VFATEIEAGIVRFIPAGIEAGSWLWSMLLTHLGLREARGAAGDGRSPLG
jgi:hypothetical protein